MKLLAGVELVAKICAGPCGLEKPVEAFNKKRDSADGLQPYCRACGRTRTRSTMRRLRALEHRTGNTPKQRFDSWARAWLERHPERDLP